MVPFALALIPIRKIYQNEEMMRTRTMEKYFVDFYPVKKKKKK